MPGYSDEVWAKVKAEWEANQLSDRELSRLFGPSRAAITKKAETEKWVRNPKPTEVVTTLVAASRADDAGGNLRAGLMAYNRVIEMLRAHRAILGRLAGLTEDQLARVEKKVKDMEAAKTPITLKNEQQIAAVLSAAMGNVERLISLQRLAMGLRKEESPSEFDGFTDGTLNELDRLTREALDRFGRVK